MSEGIDAWLSPSQEISTPAIELEEPSFSSSGVTAPQPGMIAPTAGVQLPSLPRTHVAQLWVVGAHGGAGESTLASFAHGWREAEHAWPFSPSGGTLKVVLAARSNMHGLNAAQAAATQWAAGLVPGVELLGLVISHDAPGKLPRAIRDRIKVVSGGIPRTWMLPWEESWRLGEPVSLDHASRAARALTNELLSLTN